MDPKLTTLFLLIGAIVGLSHLIERRHSEREGEGRRIWWRS